MNIAKLIAQLIALLAQITGVSFVSIKNYVSKGSNDTELQDVVINIGVSYETAKKKDIETLKSIDIKEAAKESGMDISLLEEARTALIGSLISPRKANSEGQKDAYTIICEGLKVHNETGAIYIFGMKVKKTVKVEGEFKTVNSAPLTIAKDYFRNKHMKSTKYRMYIVERIQNVVAKGDTIVIE